MSKRSKAAISSDNQQWLALQYDPHIYGVSLAVNHAISTHQQVLSNSVPRLKLEEWIAIFDCTSGRKVDSGDHPAQLPAYVAEWLAHTDRALPEKLSTLPVSELAAIEWIARRFWTRNWDDMSGYDAILSALGVEVAP